MFQRRFLMYAVIALVSIPCAAGDPPKDELADETPAVRVRLLGEMHSGWLVVRAELGVGVTRALRVYSEPSGTLLAMYVNGDVPEPVNTAWIKEVTSDNAGRVSLPLMTMPFKPGVRAVIHSRPAPVTDTKLKVLIFGSWPDEEGNVREQEIPITVRANLGSFAFTWSRYMRPALLVGEAADRSDADVRAPAAAGRQAQRRRLIASSQICCGTVEDCGGQGCKSCTGEDYCCYKSTTLNCGWCGKNEVTCGLECTPC